jgi:hypothetical protein
MPVVDVMLKSRLLARYSLACAVSDPRDGLPNRDELIKLAGDKLIADRLVDVQHLGQLIFVVRD